MMHLPVLRVLFILSGRADRHALALLDARLWLVLPLYLAIALVTGWERVGAEAVFEPYGLAVQMVYLLLLIALVASLAGHPRLLVSPAVLLGLLLEWDALLMLLAPWLLHVLPAWPPMMLWSFVALSALLWLGWWCLLARVLERAWMPLLRTSLLALVVIALTTLAHNYWGDLWYSGEDYAADEEGEAHWQAYRALNVEDVYYRQPALLDAALSAVPVSQPGVPELYFLGFSAWAHQDVFWKEMQFAQQTLDARYGLQGRSLLLVNHLSTVETHPLANRHNLKQALAGLTARMGEEDVLFLFLSSHGDREQGVAARFWPLSPTGITAEDARTLLADSGIRWRVVVVSACYAGQFVAPLQNAHSLVATAAAADKTSFGCSNENDFTWYGEALFADGLAQGEPLLQALQNSRERVAQREAAEGNTPSEPQLWLGEAMQDYWQTAIEP